MAISLVDFVNQTDQPRKRFLVQKVTNEGVMMRVLKFIPVDGFSYEYSTQETLGGVAFRALNENYTPDTGVVNPAVESLRIFGGAVKTDHQLVIKQGGAARANSILAKTRKAALFYDKYVIDGDTAINGKQFPGLNARLTGNQVIEAGANGAELSLAMVDDLIDRVAGTAEQKLLVTNKADRRKLKSLLLGAAGAASIADFGPSLSTYDGVRIEVIDEDGDEQPILAKDETQGSSNVTSSMYCIRPGSDVDGEYMQGLISGKIIDQYESGMEGVFHVDIVECNAGLALFHGRAAARLKGIL